MAVRQYPRPPGRRSGAATVAFVLGMVGLLLAAVFVVLFRGGDDGDRAPRSEGLSPADVQRDTPVPQPAPLAAGTDLATWAVAVSDQTGVPARALRAYGAAELAQYADTPDCRLSWVTLAGIARVESDHGRFGRTDLDADGVARPSIVGLPLDGSPGVQEIRDTDGGSLDGDAEFDRAIGPMQFLPTTWARYGTGNPHQIDDAARAAARYLCAEGRDTASGEGWWAGVLTYNRSVSYARLVWAATAALT